MQPHEFKPHIDKLVAIFSPRGWDAITETAYFGIVRRWSESEFAHIVSMAVQRHEYMPKPKHLVAIHDEINRRDTKQLDTTAFEGCERCNAGLVTFQMKVEGVEYDKVAACICESGQKRAAVKYGKRSMKTYREIFGEVPPVLEKPEKEIKDDVKTEIPPLEDDDLPF